ncbi:hypothetical protein DFJ63DRAFT_311506 [Scheffersomyces coipomensis]|uniref:uncharacterized protein n=1 Tax=Scheffersomyces coipomensis TaxID=1788519 RepID=UPI00315DCB56
MSDEKSFLNSYFLSLPKEIIVQIIKLNPNGLIRFLLHSKTLKPIIYDELLKDIIIYTENSGVTIGTTFKRKSQSFHKTNLDYTIKCLPGGFIPASIHFIGNVNAVINYCEDLKILNEVKDVRFSISLELGSLSDTKILLDLLRFSNLTFVEVYLHNNSEFIVSSFNNARGDTLNRIRSFAKKLESHGSWKQVVQELPSITDNIQSRGVPTTDCFVYLQNLKLIHIHDTYIPSLDCLPSALETIQISGAKFKISQRFKWPSKLKNIYINKASMDDKTLRQLSNWPQSLKLLSMTNNKFYKFSSIGNLPDSLQYLYISDLDTNRDFGFSTKPSIRFDAENFNSISSYSFPESLAALEISGINFYDQSSCVIRFPQYLRRLKITRSLKSLSNLIFPKSLTLLELNDNKIDDLTSYNDILLNKNWSSLVNLNELTLGRNILDSKSLCNWLFPSNLNRLDLSSNKIETLNIPVFTVKMNQYTSKLKVINLSSCKIKEIPPNLYLPKNLYSLYLTDNPLKKIPMQISTSYKKNLSRIIIGDRIVEIWR